MTYKLVCPSRPTTPHMPKSQVTSVESSENTLICHCRSNYSVTYMNQQNQRSSDDTMTQKETVHRVSCVLLTDCLSIMIISILTCMGSVFECIYIYIYIYIYLFCFVVLFAGSGNRLWFCLQEAGVVEPSLIMFAKSFYERFVVHAGRDDPDLLAMFGNMTNLDELYSRSLEQHCSRYNRPTDRFIDGLID